MKKFLLISFIVIASTAKQSYSQTNVSGGIYANTTWTLAGSPYIVIDTVVVFPGVTLTIDPGVTVKFENNKYIEMRQSALIADGTLANQITFTSNAASPTPGIWGSVWLNNGSMISRFNYCNIMYANTGITGYANIQYIKNTNFTYNQIGLSEGASLIDSCNFMFNVISGLGSSAGATLMNFCTISNNGKGTDRSGFGLIKNCTITWNQTGLSEFAGKMTNCVIMHNQTGMTTDIGTYNTIRNSIIDSNSVTGIVLNTVEVDSLINCEIKYNGIGLDCEIYSGTGLITQCIIENNTLGVQASYLPNGIMYCNKICNNTSYDLKHMGTYPLNVASNYWCTPDSMSTTLRIYDGYDDISLGLVTFMPLDVNNCYLTGCNVYVNSTVTNATCSSCTNGSATAHVTNGFPPYSYTWYTTPIQTTQTATALAAGTYTVCVTDGHGCTACNYNVFVDSTNCTGFAINTTSTNASCTACSDGTATVNTTAGNPPFSYTWYTSPIQTTQTATGLPTGTYAVCVNDVYGCYVCDTVTIGIGNCSAYYTIAANAAPHTYDLTNMASGTPPLTYDWNWGDTSPNDTGAYPTHTYAGAGNYNICLTITDSAGCTDNYCHSFFLLSLVASPVYVNVIPPTSTSINEAINEKAFSVYPNPTAGDLTIQFPTATDAHIVIRNMLGESVYNAEIINRTSHIIHTSFPSGIYFIEVNGHRQRFVKQ